MEQPVHPCLITSSSAGSLGCSVSWSLSVSPPAFLTSLSALLCTMIFSSQTFSSRHDTLRILELDVLQLKYDGLALSENFKALQWATVESRLAFASFEMMKSV